MKASIHTASLSFDLDNKWTYLKTYGDPSWRSLPSYIDLVVPRALEILKTHGLTITFFLVGQDAAIDRNREALASLSAAGHEIGNHTFHHDPWLHLYSPEQIDDELAMAEEHIERATGQRPVGFRGPGFSLSHSTLATLGHRGYLYDATTIPTFIGPLGRAYFLMHSNLTDEERRQRRGLYGEMRDALRPNHPYRWDTPAGELIELPITTMPFFKVPFHVSYVLYLSTFAPRLALSYFRTALQLCRLTGIQPSILLHPLDFLGSDETRDLSFFPGMKLPVGDKLDLVDQLLSMLTSQFEVRPLRQHAEAVSRAGGLTTFQHALFAPA